MVAVSKLGRAAVVIPGAHGARALPSAMRDTVLDRAGHAHRRVDALKAAAMKIFIRPQRSQPFRRGSGPQIGPRNGAASSILLTLRVERLFSWPP